MGVCQYKEDYNSRPITYELAIDLDTDNRPYVKKERLRQRRKGQKTGWPFSFLLLDEGKGISNSHFEINRALTPILASKI